MSNDLKIKEGLTRVINFFKEVNQNSDDPVKHCKVHKEIGCSHVDGFLCKMSTCNILADYTGLSTIAQIKVALNNQEINLPLVFQLLEILQDEMDTQKEINITLTDKYRHVGYLNGDKKKPLLSLAEGDEYQVPIFVDKRLAEAATFVIDGFKD